MNVRQVEAACRSVCSVFLQVKELSNWLEDGEDKGSTKIDLVQRTLLCVLLNDRRDKIVAEGLELATT